MTVNKIEKIEKNQYTYILPIGIAPSKIEDCREELEAALGGICEFDVKGRVITITVYKGSLPNNIKYHLPEQDEKGLTVPIGYNMRGELITINMADDKNCYVLCAGYQGTGKSTLARGIINAIVQYPPEWVKLVLIDLKMGVELKHWQNYPHKWLEAWNPDKPELKYVLTQLNAEIKRRYILFEEKGVRDINFYRKKIGQMSYIFLVIDEYAELSNAVGGEDMQTLLKRTLQIGRAAGLKCCLFTLRPTVDIVTGSIKALFPTRIALRCVSKLESRIILDIDGAEMLENMPGRALMLNNAKYEKIQIMNYNLSDDICELDSGEHIDSIE